MHNVSKCNSLSWFHLISFPFSLLSISLQQYHLDGVEMLLSSHWFISFTDTPPIEECIVFNCTMTLPTRYLPCNGSKPLVGWLVFGGWLLHCDVGCALAIIYHMILYIEPWAHILLVFTNSARRTYTNWPIDDQRLHVNWVMWHGCINVSSLMHCIILSLRVHLGKVMTLNQKWFWGPLKPATKVVVERWGCFLFAVFCHYTTYDWKVQIE